MGMFLLIILVSLSGLLTSIRAGTAATVNAASCTATDVQTAITSASPGDTVHLPTCDTTAWAVTITVTKSIILEGNGAANTIVRRSAVAASDFSLPMLRVVGVTNFEVRHLTMDGTYDTHPDQWVDTAIELDTVVDFNIHHATFSNFGLALYVYGDPLIMRGVIHHNTFIDNYHLSGPFGGRGYGVAMNGNGTYPALELGTAQNTFIEDNTFLRTRHTVAGNNGARYVYRYNTVLDNRENAAAIDAHGLTPSWPRGTRQWEIYNNTVDNSVARYAGVAPWGGDGVIFNNQFSANINEEIQLGQEGGCGQPYPYQDQIREAYIWNNTLLEGGAAPIFVVCPGMVQLGRDYFTTPRPGYTPYTYPHPMTVTGTSSPPTATITAPTNGATYSTSTSPLTTLAGTASDDVGVTSVTWQCLTCTPTGGTAVGTTAWSVADVGLAPGDNVFTVTPHDADQSGPADQLTVTLTSCPSTVLRRATSRRLQH